MTHHYTGAIGKRFEGNLPRAHEVQGTARLLVQQCLNEIGHRGGWGQAVRQLALRDGTIVKAIVLKNIRGFEPIVRVEVFAPQLLDKLRTTNEFFGGFVFVPKEFIEQEPDPVWPPDVAKPIPFTIGNMAPFYAYVKYLEEAGVWRSRVVDTYEPELRLHNSAPHWVTWCGFVEESQESALVRKEAVVSFNHGMTTRYRLFPDQTCSGKIKVELGTPMKTNAGLPGIHIHGKTIDTRYVDSEGFSSQLNVVGAGIFHGYPIIVSHFDPERLNDSWRDDLSDEERLYADAADDCRTASIYYYSGSRWLLAGRYRSEYILEAPWFFSPDGSHAVSLVPSGYGQQKLVLVLNLTTDAAGSKSITANVSSESLPDSEGFYIRYNYRSEEATSSSSIYAPDQYECSGERDWIIWGRTFGTAYYYDEEGEKKHFHVTSVDPNTLPEYADRNYVYHPGKAWDIQSQGSVTALMDEMLEYAEATDYVAARNDVDINSAVSCVPNVPTLDHGFAVTTIGGGMITFSVAYVFIVWGVTWVRTKSAATHTIVTWEHEVEKGKRYLAFDYTPNGELIAATLELETEGEYKFEKDTSWERIRTYTLEGLFATGFYLRTTDVRGPTTYYRARGALRWVVKIDGTELFSAKGGAEDAVVVRSGGLMEGSGYLLRGTFGANTTSEAWSNDVIEQSNEGKFVSERVWLHELDLRSRSAIYEKYKVVDKLAPIESIDEYTIGRLYRPRRDRVSVEQSLHLIANGSEVHKEIYADASAIGFPSVHIHMIQGQLLPRFYGVNHLEEEVANFPVFFVWGEEVYLRYWGAHSMFDVMPHRLRPGEIQTRFKDVSISTYPRALREITSLMVPDYQNDYQKWRPEPVNYTNISTYNIGVVDISSSLDDLPLPDDYKLPSHIYCAPLTAV